MAPHRPRAVESHDQLRTYWCRWLNESGWPVGAENIRAMTDELALAKARVIAANYACASLELWEGKRLAGREQISDAPLRQAHIADVPRAESPLVSARC